MKRALVTGALFAALLLAACTPAGDSETPIATDSGLETPIGIATEPGDVTTPLATAVMPTDAPTEVATEALTPVTTPLATAPVATAAATGEATAAPSTEVQPSVLLATELTGSQIVDADGEPMGDVMELLVGEAGVIEYVVFDATNYLMGAGGDAGTAATPAATEPAGSGLQSDGIVAVPPSEFQVNSGMSTGAEANEQQVLVYQGTAETLADMGGFDLSVLEQDGFIIDTTGTGLDESFNGLIRVSEFSDFDLRSTADEDLGEVEDLVVDLSQNKVTYGVVDFGGFLGIAEQTTAVPWEMFSLRQDADIDNFVLEITQDTLENAPTIDLGAWPAWHERIDGNPDWNADWDLDVITFWEAVAAS